MQTQCSHYLVCRFLAGKLLLGIVLIDGCAITAVTAISAPLNRIQSATSQTVNIKIRNFKFVPATVTVEPGIRIVWANLDAVAHSIVSDNGAFPASSPLNTGNTYSLVLSTPGNYSYHCGIHSFMRGDIRIVAATVGDSH